MRPTAVLTDRWSPAGPVTPGRGVGELLAVVKSVEPEVHLIARPELDYDEIARYLADVGGQSWLERLDRGELDDQLNDPQNLAEFAGRLCYRSWEPGLNPNVTRVRTDQSDYLRNILRSMHGSVLEHLSFSFVLHNVSRVLTHELVRHRPGTAISQESMRFVRLTDLPFWFPDWAKDDPELMKRATEMLGEMERFQRWLADHFGLDEEEVRFAEKKHRTSFMRRFAPEGVATGLVWTANARTLRHTLQARTAPGAEEEIRLLFARIGEVMVEEAPALFGDFEVDDGAWVPAWRKV
ncbi:FAD-dependent thymidylate synthase [Salinactinospora qingdaonensis]|uniref:FAD-dependent thymidylate synthase n=1 Tax=Salinactinospora qingdaonensis TaxID=702744 RepID=A0ABP7FHW9_9ACTN